MLLVTASAFVSGQANAAGCVKGAVTGAAVGHVLGAHAVVGAVGGCLIERRREKKEKQERDAAGAKKRAAESFKTDPVQQKRINP